MKHQKNASISVGTLCMILCGWIYTGFVHAQITVEANQDNWTVYQGDVSFDGDIIHVVTKKNIGEPAILWLNNTTLAKGSVELDIKGDRTFIGIAFHALDNENYDAIYFRPFNFNSPEKSGNSVQYVDLPNHEWEMLRTNFPGKYESAVTPAPKPNEWFHATITFDFPEVKVYVDGSAEPSLVVDQLSERKDGKLGLWMALNGNEGWFKNVQVTNSN